MLKKADIALIIILIIFAFVFVFIFEFQQETGTIAVVTVDGKVVGEFPLNRDSVLWIGEDGAQIKVSTQTGEPALAGHVHNIAEIAEGSIHMTAADCRDGLCIKQGSISHTNQTLVCLPNKVVIEIRGGGQSIIDAVSQ